MQPGLEGHQGAGQGQVSVVDEVAKLRRVPPAWQKCRVVKWVLLVIGTPHVVALAAILDGRGQIVGPPAACETERTIVLLERWVHPPPSSVQPGDAPSLLRRRTRIVGDSIGAAFLSLVHTYSPACICQLLLRKFGW